MSADRHWREEYAQYFEAAGVDPLWCGDGPEHAYRFLRSPSYRPAYIIDVRQRDDGWHVRAVVFEDPREQGKRPPVTTIVRTSERMISVEERQALLAALEEASFWSTRPWPEAIGFDGETWLIEGRSRNRYRAVSRWGPTQEDAAFWRAGVVFFKLAQLPVPPEAREE